MKKIKISLFWIFFIVFLLSGCSKSKILRIEDSNYCFNEKSFERVYEVNELINAFNIEIVFPDGINKNDIETGSLLVFVEKEDGHVDTGVRFSWTYGPYSNQYDKDRWYNDIKRGCSGEYKDMNAYTACPILIELDGWKMNY